MIIKLCREGSVDRYIEARDVFSQPVMGGGIDLEVVGESGKSQRFMLYDAANFEDWQVAYILERGKTIDVIRPFKSKKGEA